MKFAAVIRPAPELCSLCIRPMNFVMKALQIFQTLSSLWHKYAGRELWNITFETKCKDINCNFNKQHLNYKNVKLANS